MTAEESTTDIANQITARTAGEADLPFIYSSWLKSYRNSNFAKPISNDVYYENHHDIIEDLLASSQVILACNVNDPAQIMGYVVASKINGILTYHYLYVKHTYRRLGIGKLLFNVFEQPDQPACYTHETATAKKLAPRYNLIYNPYLIVINSKENPSLHIQD